MRILFTVQRYGTEIAGGAEQHCRWLAEGMAAKGHEVHVLTSCAVDYMSWKNHFVPGESVLNKVFVHRFSVERERNVAFFNQTALQIDFKEHSSPLVFEDIWLYEQGPAITGFHNWLAEVRSKFDVVVPFTYLYSTSQIAVDTFAGHVPIVMHATAHDENPLYLRRIGEMLCKIDRFLCSTPEEKQLLQDVWGQQLPCDVVGVGVQLQSSGDLKKTLRRLQVPDEPYFVVVGRIDPSKGTDVAARCFQDWKKSTQRSANLLAIGGFSDEYANLLSGSGIYSTGYVSEVEKSTLMKNAIALIQPSSFESFSLVLCESWLAGRPTIANGSSNVLTGQTRRSGGGLTYVNTDELLEHLTFMFDHPSSATSMGMRGREYVQSNYNEEVVLNRIEEVLSQEAKGRKAKEPR